MHHYFRKPALIVGFRLIKATKLYTTFKQNLSLVMQH